MATSVQLTIRLFPGAPSMACLQMRPLHGLNRPKPASASQFFVTQSSLTYSPGEPHKNITVEIATHSDERHFRGFLVKAYDAINGRHIGQFAGSPDARPVESCSAATHRNNQEKKRVLLIWQPPAQPQSSSSSSTGGDTGAFGDWMSSLRALGNQKRQLPADAPGTTPSPAATTRQVRFKATIVVSYSEFYTEFESSEKIFEEFGYSKPAAA